ncbi:MAG: FAD-binding oxidoreductase [Cyanobacteriota bacterium]|nr:FAD-binding oxidoreductase [Cyanobacteriota bacterium]
MLSIADLSQLPPTIALGWNHPPDLTWQKVLQSMLSNPLASPPLLIPETPVALAEMVSYAAERQWRLLPAGQGSKLTWGSVIPEVDAVVSTQKLNRLLAHAASDLTATVQAGLKLVDLQATLAGSGQFWPVDPLFPDQATVGGILATGDAGSWRQRYGGIRDLVLGVTFVRADGQSVKAGGRVVKNVAGYDLMKLLTGSHGTLGMVTEMHLRLYPLPACRQYLLMQGSAEDLPCLAELVHQVMAAGLYPTTLDGLVEPAWGSQPLGVLLEWHGSQGAVTEQVEQVQQWGSQQGLTADLFLPADPLIEDLYRGFSDSQAILLKLAVPPQQAMSTLAAIQQTCPQSRVQIHLGSGLGRCQLPVAGTTAAEIEQLRGMVEATGGFLTVLQAPLALKLQVEVWGYRGNALALMQQVRQQFDPQGRWVRPFLGSRC